MTQVLDGAFASLTGPEPVWTGYEDDGEYALKVRQHLSYCNYHFTIKDLKADVMQCCALFGFTKDELTDLSESFDFKRKISIPTPAALCRAVNRGAILKPNHREVISRDFRQVIADYRAIK